MSNISLRGWARSSAGPTLTPESWEATERCSATTPTSPSPRSSGDVSSRCSSRPQMRWACPGTSVFAAAFASTWSGGAASRWRSRSPARTSARKSPCHAGVGNNSCELHATNHRLLARMTTFVLVPGAGGVAWYWHQVVRLLQAASHDAIAVDLPGDDEGAGLSTYADRVIKAIDGRTDVALVVQSLGGFTAPLVCARVRLRMLVFVNAMIPVSGERAGAWWGSTGLTAARTGGASPG